jgi:hypothetical protein
MSKNLRFLMTANSFAFTTAISRDSSASWMRSRLSSTSGRTEARPCADYAQLFKTLCITASLAVLCGSCGKPAERGSGSSALGQLPFGAVDTPAAGQTLRGQVLVGGWALSEAGIRQVAV